MRDWRRIWIRVGAVVVLVAGAGWCGQCARDSGRELPREVELPGVRYWLVTRSEPRVLRIHHVRVDLGDERVELVAAVGRDPDGEGPATAELTAPRVLAKGSGSMVFVNANPWRSLPDGEGKRSDDWVAGMPVEIAGLVSAGGEVRSKATDPTNCSVWMDGHGKMRIGKPADGEVVRAGVAGFGRLVEGGKVVARKEAAVHPRTAAGVDATGRYLFLVVVDGRQPGYSEGMSAFELAEYMVELGCVAAANLDGGGSSILLMADGKGDYDVMNSPSKKVLGVTCERPLPVGLGVRVKTQNSKLKT